MHEIPMRPSGCRPTEHTTRPTVLTSQYTIRNNTHCKCMHACLPVCMCIYVSLHTHCICYDCYTCCYRAAARGESCPLRPQAGHCEQRQSSRRSFLAVHVANHRKAHIKLIISVWAVVAPGLMFSSFASPAFPPNFECKCCRF